ncbi:MAG: DUF3604 domain-containing protein [Halieaceae bacterium]|jgi:hypothetical protein|nr:DUF3604 domain-containing protein [Halieaceae bacterium]
MPVQAQARKHNNLMLTEKLIMKKCLVIPLVSIITALALPTASASDTRRLLWGDTHLHTSYSADAFMAGNRDADPDVAYRFARGEPVIHPYARNRVQINEPLDFLAVTDHAEYLGVLPPVLGGDFDQPEASLFQKLRSRVLISLLNWSIEDPQKGTKYFTMRLPTPEIQSGDIRDPIQTAVDAGTNGGLESLGLINDDAAKRISGSQWSRSMMAAERHNEPGVFTTLVGWEWSQTASGANLHRIVVSDISPLAAQQIDPVGADDAPYPEQLWDGLDMLTRETGASFVAIPHNSNLSKGYMFARRQLNGEAMTPAYASKRARWEPLVEMTQIKGDSETHPDLAPEDEFADFERFDFYLQKFPQAQGYKIQRGDTIRSALQDGMVLERETGVNPFQFGLIGSTDSHTGMSSAEEPNFWGKVAVDSIPENKRRNDPDGYADGKQSFNGWSMQAAGLAAVWSERNDRQSIIAAMKRRETYASTGPRIWLRAFAGWDFDQEDLAGGDFAARGYARGVPMGGELATAPEGAVPHFMIMAARGANDHNLDRIQVVKSWLDAEGQPREKIFDVAWSGPRSLDAEGKLPPIGNSANIRTGKTTNTIGAGQLATVWPDPEFDPASAAVYYVRVLQIPTVRHSQMDATALGIETPYEGPATIQERAYSSPFWYRP